MGREGGRVGEKEAQTLVEDRWMGVGVHWAVVGVRDGAHSSVERRGEG